MSDWSSDVYSSGLPARGVAATRRCVGRTHAVGVCNAPYARVLRGQTSLQINSLTLKSNAGAGGVIWPPWQPDAAALGCHPRQCPDNPWHLWAAVAAALSSWKNGRSRL